MIRIRWIGGRIGWGVADQGLSSVTNFALGIAIARTATPEEFGVYGLLLSAYLISINITRPIAVEPLLIRFSGRNDGRWRGALSDASGAVLTIGLLLGATGLLISATQSGFLGSGFRVLGLLLPGLVLQDSWRFALFGARRGRIAFANDLVWAVTLGLVIAFLYARGAATPLNLFAAWGLSGNVAAVAGIFQTGTLPRPIASRRWWRTTQDLGRSLLGDRIATNVVGELTPYAIGGIAGLSAVGALRASQLLLGPFTVIYQGLSLVALPEAVGIADRPDRMLIKAAGLYSGLLAVLVLATGVSLFIVPADAGRLVLGQNWATAHDTLIPFTILIAVQMAVAGPLVGLRALGEARATFRVGVIRSVFGFIGAVLGAVLGGAPAAAAGMALGNGAGGIETWREFVHAIHRRHPGRSDSTLSAGDEAGAVQI
jgi:O-antigen/teichoic acid export membrane protein